MTDYSYTISDWSARLEHVAVIDRGGFGEVHKVAPVMVEDADL
jgi:hypothetical protein